MAKKALMVATVAPTIGSFNMENIRILQEMGYEVHVAADFTDTSVWSTERLEKFKDQLKQLGIPYFQINFSRSPVRIGSHIAAYKELKSLIDKEQYDIIHCHTPICAALTRLAASDARKHGSKVIYTAHGFHFYKGAPLANWLLYYPVERLLAPKTDVLITINREDYERAKTFKAVRVEYIPGVGIDIRKFQEQPKRESETLRHELGIPLDATVLLSVGEVNRNKNHKVVIEALPDLPGAYYVICGTGPLMDDLRALSKKLNVSGRFIMAGYRTDVADFYQMADIFVFPSLREGLGMALIEALACGMPALAMNTRGPADIIRDGENGFLMENNVDAWANQITNLLQNREALLKLRNAARDSVSQYDINRVLPMLKKLYADV